MKQTALIGLNYILQSIGRLESHIPIMFEGEKGCGKSSLAFLRAEAFGAPTENISQINCGYLRKIDDARQLIDDLNRSSLFGEKKILILDEIHQLTKEAQSAWLIPLEPQNLNKNVLIIACTTEVGGLLETLLRRFVRFRVQLLSSSNSKILVDKLCEENGFKLSKIAKVLLLDKTFGNPGLIISNIQKLNGIEEEVEIRYLLELSSLEVDSDTLEFFKILKATSDWEIIRKSLIKLLKIKSPSEIKAGLMNLTAGWFTSDFYKPSETDVKLLKLYHSLIVYNSPLEKANLIVAIKSI